MSDPSLQPSAHKASQAQQNEQSKSDAPASLSMDKKKQVPRDKPKVKPPFANISMNTFLSNLMLFLVAILAFYIWRVTVWASESGGYWALLTGSKSAGKEAAEAAASVSSLATAGLAATQSLMSKQTASASGSGKAGSSATPFSSGTGQSDDVQSQIYHLASLLGVLPADLTAAIRPLVDPTVPNPVEEVKRIKEQAELKGHILEKEKVLNEKQQEEGKGRIGILEVMEEAFLD